MVNPIMSIENQVQVLVTTLNQWNQAYRVGKPIVSDAEFDITEEELRSLAPDHVYFQSTAESGNEKGKPFNHVIPMLSTQKAYLVEEVEAFIVKVKRHQKLTGTTTATIRATPKLDGNAAFYRPQPRVLATRGENGVGTDISWLIDSGLKIVGDINRQGVGEIVISKRYFKEHLSTVFKHPRNVVAGIINSESLSEHAKQALDDGAVELVLYNDIPTASELSVDIFAQCHEIVEESQLESPYPLDGVVYEVVEPQIRESMGSGHHHHHFQIAKKRRGETRTTKVLDVEYNTGRTGVISATLILDPVELSGATISRATTSNYRNYINKGWGIGAEVFITRSGEVVPFCSGTVSPAEVEIIKECPCCKEELTWSESMIDLYCNNEFCRSRLAAQIEYHFKMIGVKGIGEATANALVDGGVVSIECVYNLNLAQWVEHGVASGIAANIMNEVERVQTTPLHDYLYLASFGISDLGRRSSTRLLSEFDLSLIPYIQSQQIESLNGFGSKTANSIRTALVKLEPQITRLKERFHITSTKDRLEQEEKQQAAISHPLKGKVIVFTGKCQRSRSEMEQDAKSKGAIPESRVKKGCNLLVCGLNVGQTKINSASDKGVKVITEEEYWSY